MNGSLTQQGGCHKTTTKELHLQCDSDREILTVMYLTSMSVFLSSSAIISRWNLLNFRRRRKEWGRSKRREHMQMIREWTQDGACRAIVVNGQREVSTRRLIIRAESLHACRGECRVLALRSWMSQKQSVGKTPLPSCSHSLEPEWGQRWPSLQPHWGTSEVSAMGHTDGFTGSVPLKRQRLVCDAPTGAWRRSFCIISRPDETPWLIRLGSFTYQPTRCCRFSVTFTARRLQLLSKHTSVHGTSRKTIISKMIKVYSAY